MSMFSLGSMLNSARMMSSLNNSYQKKDNSLYEKRTQSGAYDKLAELSPELAAMQQHVDRLHDQTGTVLDKLISPEQNTDSIVAKLNSGQPLSSSELEHLRKTDPELYSKAVQVEAEREAYEEKLKQCRTKEDVQRLRTYTLSAAMGRVNGIANNPNIPEGKKIEMLEQENRRVQAVNEATAKFVRSADYARLPSEAEEDEREAERAQGERAARPEEEKTVEDPSGEATEEAAQTQEGGEPELPSAQKSGETGFKFVKAAPTPGEGDYKPQRAADHPGYARAAYRQHKLMKP